VLLPVTSTALASVPGVPTPVAANVPSDGTESVTRTGLDPLPNALAPNTIGLAASGATPIAPGSRLVGAASVVVASSATAPRTDCAPRDSRTLSVPPVPL
jgi:hypothetical protein